MSAHMIGTLAVVAILSFASPGRGQAPGAIDLQAAEVAAELIGAPAFAADGPEIGEVADLLFDADGQARKVRIKAAAHLGLGTRTLEVPQGAFTLLRGAVVLDLPAEALRALPDPAEFEVDR
jgi:PRC-barrel domain